MQGVNEIIVWLMLAGIVLLAVVLYGVAKMFLRLRQGGAKDRGSNVDFVVDTFHGLVTQFKDKEKELEVLRNKAEERAGIIEDYNENILQSVPSGVISLNGDQRIVKVNASAERILGIKASDVIGSDASLVFSSGLDPRGLGSVERGETGYMTSSGRRLWLGYSLTPLLDEQRRPIGQLLIFTDLTELKALQSQAELRQRLSSLGEMAAGIAHELRNSMGVISGYMRLLSGKVGPQLKNTVSSVSREVDAMDRIITDFLSFARPRELELAELNLFGLVEECVRNVLSGRNDINVSLDIDRGLAIRADGKLLRQVFTNLALNAAQAQRDGGSLSFTSELEGDYVKIWVSDAGHGIDEGIWDRIFLPFFTTKEKGTGLGLALVHRIIVSHGGAIVLENSGPEGTTFRIALPM
jgi:PAS domain S-box-containing protein